MDRKSKMAVTVRLDFNTWPYGKMNDNIFLEIKKHDRTQTVNKRSMGGLLQIWYILYEMKND
jgi:hypothetical protein